MAENEAAAVPAQPTADEYYASRVNEAKTEAAPAPKVIPEPPLADAPKTEPEAAAAPAQEAKEPAEDTATEDADKPEDEAKPEEPKKSRRTLREENFRLRERNRALTAEAELLRTRGQQPEAPKTADTSNPELKRPKQEDFESYDLYLDARDAWNRQEWRKEEDARTRQRDNERQLQSQQTEATQRFNESADKARTKYEDFDESVWELGYKITGSTAALIAQTDNPGEVAYHLSKNPSEAARIAKLPDARAAIELGKIDARIAVQADTPKPAPKAEVKPIPETKAPPPPKPVPQGTARPSRPLEEMSQSDFYSARKAEVERPIQRR